MVWVCHCSKMTQQLQTPRQVCWYCEEIRICLTESRYREISTLRNIKMLKATIFFSGFSESVSDIDGLKCTISYMDQFVFMAN